jgi:hypothetical protein
LAFLNPDEGNYAILVVTNNETGVVTEYKVAYALRTGKEISFAEFHDGDLFWHSFGVSKFDPDITAALPVNDLVRIGA